MFCMLINSFVLNTILPGYESPFVALPSTCYLENNASSILVYQATDFVKTDIKDLLKKGFVRTRSSCIFRNNQLYKAHFIPIS